MSPTETPSGYSLIFDPKTVPGMSERVQRRVLQVNLPITTVCNRRCPMCCCRDIVHHGERKHISPDRVYDDIKRLGRVGAFFLTGGEPTMHPQFAEVMRAARDAAGRGTLVLVTNGAKLIEHAEATRYLDVVRLSVLSDDCGAETTEAYKKVAPTGVLLDAVPTEHVDTGGGPEPCQRFLYTISVMEGRAYPCCVACGVADAEYTTLDDGWFRRVKAIKPPCERCVLGEEGGSGCR